MILVIKHVDIEGPETLGTFFIENNYAFEEINLYAGDHLPLSFKRVEAVISLGGPMNVDEESRYSFLKEEDLFLKQVIAQKIPFLGICLGAQLLAKAAGGAAVRSPEQEIGWFDIELTEEGQKDPLFKGLPSIMEVYQWHGDMCQLPLGASLLARSSRCPVQAFKVGRMAYGLQFHAEITDKSITDWTRADVRFIEEQQRMLERYRQIKDVFHGYGRVIGDNFMSIMKGK